jgi:hypothetical protein
MNDHAARCVFHERSLIVIMNTRGVLSQLRAHMGRDRDRLDPCGDMPKSRTVQRGMIATSPMHKFFVLPSHP